MKCLLVFDSRGARFTKEFESETERNDYVDQVVLPQYSFAKLPPIVMRIGQVLFVGDELPESVNEPIFRGNYVHL